MLAWVLRLILPHLYDVCVMKKLTKHSFFINNRRIFGSYAAASSPAASPSTASPCPASQRYSSVRGQPRTGRSKTNCISRSDFLLRSPAAVGLYVEFILFMKYWEPAGINATGKIFVLCVHHAWLLCKFLNWLDWGPFIYFRLGSRVGITSQAVEK
jgi:hypothetical protein